MGVEEHRKPFPIQRIKITFFVLIIYILILITALGLHGPKKAVNKLSNQWLIT